MSSDDLSRLADGDFKSPSAGEACKLAVNSGFPQIESSRVILRALLLRRLLMLSLGLQRHFSVLFAKILSLAAVNHARSSLYLPDVSARDASARSLR